MNELYKLVLIDEMREKRNTLLFESDLEYYQVILKIKTYGLNIDRNYEICLLFELKILSFQRHLKTHFC
jgi:hypothetical protein